MTYPSILSTKDGWIQIVKKSNELTKWNIGSLDRYIKIGLYFIDTDCQVWKASGYQVISSPPKSRIRNIIDFLRYGIPPISEVALEYDLIERDGLDLFKKLILNDPPKKKVVFSAADLSALKNVKSVKELLKIIKKSEMT